MSHDHHWCACNHDNLAYCATCNVVYCKDCKKEWVEKATWVTYTWNSDNYVFDPATGCSHCFH